MHELGIIVNINKTLAEVAADNGVSRISRVTLELGEVSGIVPELLEDCRRQADGLWEADRPKKWYCALPIAAVWALTLWLLLRWLF